MVVVDVVRGARGEHAHRETRGRSERARDHDAELVGHRRVRGAKNALGRLEHAERRVEHFFLLLVVIRGLRQARPGFFYSVSSRRIVLRSVRNCKKAKRSTALRRMKHPKRKRAGVPFSRAGETFSVPFEPHLN